MPLTVGPDPNTPGKLIWIDSATGQPAQQPGGPGTAYVPGSQVPAATNIDPNDGAPKQPTPSEQAQANSAARGQTPPSVGTPQGPTGLFTVDQTTAAAAQEVQSANVNTAAVWDQINKQQAEVQRITQDPASVGNPALLQNATSTLNTLYNSLSAAQQRVETANAAYSTSLTNAIKANQVDPAQVGLAQAQADAAKSNAETAARQVQVLENGQEGARALTAAQAGAQAAAAARDQAAADAQKAKTPAEKAVLEAQSRNYDAQANQTNLLIGTPDNPGPLIRKANEEVATQTATTAQVSSQADLNKALAAQADAHGKLEQAQTTTLVPAEAAAQYGGAAQAQATAQATLEGIKQKQLGPLYGLQDQINAIQAVAQQVFGPGGSGNPQHADDLLNQYVTATIGGTTPYAASVAAANAQQNQFQTQAAMANQASQSAAARAGQFANFAGGALGTLAQMNQYAPKGSTGGGAAFSALMDDLTQRLGGPQAFAPPNMQQLAPTPQLPSFLQAFAAGHQAGQAQAQASASPAQGQQAPTVNVNVNGQPAGSTAPPPTAAPAGPSPDQAFAQGFANNAPVLPNYLSGLTDPMSMLRTAANNPGLLRMYNQGPGPGTPLAGSLNY